MPKHRNRKAVFAEDGLLYGREWEPDPIDAYADKILWESSRRRRQSEFPTVGLEVGCHWGMRAFDIAKNEVVDRIVALDITDHGQKRRFDQWNADYPVTEIEFRQQDVATMQPQDFTGMQVVLANYRRVPHFQPENDVCHSLTMFRNTIAKGGLVVVTFDLLQRGEKPLSLLNQTNRGDAGRLPGMEFGPGKGGNSAYGTYRGEEVEEYMSDLGFEILRDSLTKDPRKGDYNIVAFAPSA